MTDQVDKLSKLRRKRGTQRANASRFINQINTFDTSTTEDDIQHCHERLQETLNSLIVLDDSIQDLLNDTEYDADVGACEDYIDKCKRALRKAKGLLSTERSEGHNAANTQMAALNQTAPEIKLPTIKLPIFSGDIETWPTFWEQFETSIDKNSGVSPINKHVFLRSYLQGEPKNLVDGISVTAATYEQTKQILRSKYGDKNKIIQSHIDFLENLNTSVSDNPEALNATYVECHRRIQALRALGEDVDSFGRILAPKVLRAFPEAICKQWFLHAKRQNVQEGNLTKLMEFLNEEVEGALATQKIHGDTLRTTSYLPTATAFHINSKANRTKHRQKRETEPFCVFCENKGHWGQDCTQVTSLQGRIDKLKTTKRCFLCLRRGHNKDQCFKREKGSCTKCRGKHHVSICGENDGLRTTVSKIGVSIFNFTYLQTARVWVRGPTGKGKLTRVILDPGSQSSFIHHSLIDSLQLSVTDNKTLEITAFESPCSTSVSRRQVRFDLIGHSSRAHVSVTAFESHNEYSVQPTTPQDVTIWASVDNINLADPQDAHDDLPIEILVGADHYWKIVTLKQPIRISHSLVLLPTIFGYILSGNRSGTTVNQIAVHHVQGCSYELSDETVRTFWDLDSIGIQQHQERVLTAKDSAILQKFRDSYQISEGRRVVSLPRKADIILSSNLSTAENRFHSLENRLQNNEELKTIYHTTMLNYIQRDQVELSPKDSTAGNVYYLPHHIVKKHKGTNTKYRIVFDASSHEPDSPSLNDGLEMGPNLLPDILATLLRFRKYPRGIVCDVDQAFLQLILHEEDRDLTRFIWYRLHHKDDGTYDTSNETTTYRFKRLPFGLTSSPFLLSAAIRESAELHKHEYPMASALVDMSTFMDDFTTSVEDDGQALTLYHEITALFREINLPLSKWATNSKTLKARWRTEGLEDRSVTSVLGINWDTEKDCICSDYYKIVEDIVARPATKRNVLRTTAQFYDPLGLFSPVGIVAKLIFQDTWLRGLAWEEVLPTDLATNWHSWISKLHNLSALRIPRWIGTTEQDQHPEIHMFCDASERAYGAVIYVISTTDNIRSGRLVCSKNRLAPVKKVTLPRLELLAALVGSRLLHYLCQQTGFDASKATLWSDSTITLGWIRSDPNQWKTFVCNRATEILDYTTPSQWRHCPGDQNPADYLTRGMEADQLVSLERWWFGPPWLSQDRHLWPSDTSKAHAPLPEARKKADITMIRVTQPLLTASDFSSYWRLLHVTAFVLRFVKALKDKIRHATTLTASELQVARTYWIKRVQEERFTIELAALRKGEQLPKTSKISRFNPFLDEGLIRLGGRLQCADLPNTEKHPVILDGSHHFTQLLIKHTHIRLHHLGVRIVLGELRQEFWILRARQVIKKVLYSCLPCKIAHNRKYDQIEAPLPSDRVTPLQPFAVTGIDFAGPLYIKSGNQTRKSYMVLFTCATTRAVHIELATDMSTGRFLMAMQRFAGRRSLPHTVYSDNATTFHAANKELADLLQVLQDPEVQLYSAHHGITWKFIAPRAAWWGGWWERMIGTTKRCLRKVLGRSQLDEEGLNTILVSIEAAINSRPITQDGQDMVLTPAHFLHGDKLTIIPHGPEPTTRNDLSKEFRLRQKISDDLWRRWKKEYLLLLRNYHEVRGHPARPKPRVGEVVLLQEDTNARHMWKRAVVEEVRPGRDNKIRCLVLRQPDGTKTTRPVQLVIPLEIDQGGEDVGE